MKINYLSLFVIISFTIVILFTVLTHYNDYYCEIDIQDLGYELKITNSNEYKLVEEGNTWAVKGTCVTSDTCYLKRKAQEHWEHKIKHED